MNTTPQAISIKEFAQVMDIHTASVRRMIERGQLKSIKIPGLTSVRISVSEVNRLLGKGESDSGEQKEPSAATADPHGVAGIKVTP